MLSEKLLVLAAAATALLATTVLAALTAFAGSVTQEGLHNTLARATFATSGAQIITHVEGSKVATDPTLDAALRRTYRDVPLTVEVMARGDTYVVPGQEKRGHPDLTLFATFEGIERHAALTEGRWPAAAPRDRPAEAVLPVPAARALRLKPGDTITLHGRVDRSIARVTVTGLYQPRRSDDYFWRGDRLATTGVERLDYTTYGPFVVPAKTFGDRFAAGGVDARRIVQPDMRRIGSEELPGLADRVRAMTAELRTGKDGQKYSVITGLPELAEQLHSALLVARSTMLIPVLQLMVLAGYALVLVARLLAEHRRGEVALLRARGAAMSQLARPVAAEGLVVVLPAALMAPLLADPVLWLAGRAPAVRASGLKLDASPSAAVWAVSLGAAAVCALVLVLPTVRGAARTYVATHSGRAARHGTLQRSGADLALLAVAGLGIWQLTRYGGPVVAERGSVGGIDPFIVTGPALALLAGGVLLLRLLPVVSRSTELLTARRRGFVSATGTRQVSRRPLRYAGPALLLVMAIAVGVLSVTSTATWRRSQTDQADFQAAADLRVTPPERDAPLPLGVGAPLAALPGVTTTSPVVRREAAVGGQAIALVAADADVAGSLLRLRPDLSGGARPAGLAAGRPAARLVTLPGHPVRIDIDFKLVYRGGNPPEGIAEHRASVTVIDGRGVAYRVDLGALPPDGRVHTFPVRAADLAGPGGALTYPLAVKGVHYDYVADPAYAPMEFAVTRVRADGAAVPPPAVAGWDTFLTSGDLVPGRPTVRPGSFLTVEIPRSRIPAEDFLWRGGLATMNAQLIAPADRQRHGAEQTPPAPIPAIITSVLAGKARAKVGGTMSVDLGDGVQPVTVAGIARALPSTTADKPGVLVDLRTFNERRLAGGRTGYAPSEWWLAVHGGNTGPAAAKITDRAGWRDAVIDRMALRRELRDAPLGAALQGALVLGFAAALAFAVIGFVVNTTVSARERTAEFAVLRALGVSGRQVLGLLAVEQAFLAALGLAGGTLLGMIVAALVVPHIVLTVRAAVPYPPVELVVDWPPILVMLAGVLVLLGVVLLALVASLRRHGLGSAVRLGEER